MADNRYNSLSVEGDLDENGQPSDRKRLTIKREDGETRGFPITKGLAKKLKPITEQNKPRLLTEADPDAFRRL